MLRFRLTILVLLLCITAVTWYSIYRDWSFFWPVMIVILITGSLVLFYGSYYINSGFYVKTASYASTAQKQMAISFDDGPLPEFTPQILDILKEKNVPATFFCIGKHADQYPHLLKQIHNDGHIIGNHSYTHGKWFDLLSAKKMYADLQQMNTITRQTIGVTPLLFRPPYGVTNPNLAKAIQQSGFTTVGWSVRSLDTVASHTDKLLQRVVKKIKPGSVVLLHDTCAITVATLPVLIDTVKAQGYDIVPLHKMLNLQPYA